MATNLNETAFKKAQAVYNDLHASPPTFRVLSEAIQAYIAALPVAPVAVSVKPLPSDEMIEAGARAVATRHYIERLNEEPGSRHVQMNVDANWHTFADDAQSVLIAALMVSSITPPAKTEGVVEALLTDLSQRAGQVTFAEYEIAINKALAALSQGIATDGEAGSRC